WSGFSRTNSRIASREGRKSPGALPEGLPEIRRAKTCYSFFAEDFLAAGFFAVAFFAVGFLAAFLAGALRAPPDLPALAAMSSSASSTVMAAGSLPFGSVALTLPQLT